MYNKTFNIIWYLCTTISQQATENIFVSFKTEDFGEKLLGFVMQLGIKRKIVYNNIRHFVLFLRHAKGKHKGREHKEGQQVG